MNTEELYSRASDLIDLIAGLSEADMDERTARIHGFNEYDVSRAIIKRSDFRKQLAAIPVAIVFEAEESRAMYFLNA